MKKWFDFKNSPDVCAEGFGDDCDCSEKIPLMRWMDAVQDVVLRDLRKINVGNGRYTLRPSRDNFLPGTPGYIDLRSLTMEYYEPLRIIQNKTPKLKDIEELLAKRNQEAQVYLLIGEYDPESAELCPSKHSIAQRKNNYLEQDHTLLIPVGNGKSAELLKGNFD